MSDWMHCNKCSIRYNRNFKLFLTECGHLFCERCVEKIRDSKCVICQKSTTVVEISKDLDVKIQPFFTPFEIFLQKALQVYNFQNEHRGRLFKATLQKYDYAKKECISCHHKFKDIIRENNMLKAIVMSGQNPPPFLTSTPAVAADNNETDTMSMLSSIGFTPTLNNNSGIPGYARRIFSSSGKHPKAPLYQPHLFNSGSSKGPSPAQMVPNMAKNLNMAPIHRPYGAAVSLEQLRRGRRP